MIPVGGLIMLNDALDKVVLVRGFKNGSSWMFPRGKVDQREEDLACAVRETLEETGFDAKANGLIPRDGALKKLEQQLNGQKVMLFIVPNVPEDFPFEPRARNEIGAIEWYKLADLPGWNRKKKVQDAATAATKGLKAFQVSPFLGELRNWIKEQRKMKDRSRAKYSNGHLSQAEVENNITEDEMGFATGQVPEAAPIQRSVKAQEAATRQIHRLLNMQPPPQLLQTAHGMEQSHMPSQQDANRDKSKALLALLKQKQDLSQQLPRVAQPDPYAPNNSMDHIYNIAPQLQTPQHHVSVHRLPPQGSHQAPPLFATQHAQPDIEKQLLSALGVSKPSLDQAMWQQAQTKNHQQTVHHQQVVNDQAFQRQQALDQQQTPIQQQTLFQQQALNQQALNQQQATNQQALNQQRAMGVAAATANRTPLAHPQPLPRQANHILAGAVPASAVSNNRSGQMHQQSQYPGSIPGSLNLPQQLVANLPKRPDVLNKDHLALLGAFKKGASPANGAPSKSQLSRTSATETPQPTQQQQQQQATTLGSPYTGEPRAYLAVQNGTSGMPTSHASPQLAMAALRPRKNTPSQQNALMSLLGRPSGSSPRVETVRPDLKENGAPHSSVQALALQHRQSSASFDNGLEPLPTVSQSPAQGNARPQLPYGAQKILTRPKNMEQRTPQPQFASHTVQQLGAFRVDGASSDSRPQMLGSPLTPYAGGSPYNVHLSPAHIGLHTPLPRSQEANPQRQHELLSLFGKSPAAAAPAARHEGRRPTPGSQAPISPENAKFFLDYLNGVTNAAE